jgi:hypothetical protein
VIILKGADDCPTETGTKDECTSLKVASTQK